MKYKRSYRVFTIADYEREAGYLRAMHRQGWKLKKVSFSPFLIAVKYRFERCPSEDVVYQLDFYPLEKAERANYLQLFADCGWEHITDFNQFSYFRKPVSEIESQAEFEIYNDVLGKLEMMKRLLVWRFLPALLVLLVLSCFILVNLGRWLAEGWLTQTIVAIDCFLLLVLGCQVLYIAWQFWQKRRRLKEEE